MSVVWESGVVTVWDDDRTRCAYDTVADTYADHFTGTEPELGLELAMVQHFAGLLTEPRRTLDAGCGAGRMMPYLASLGCQVEGIDLSEGMIRRARQDHPQHPAQVASLSDLPFPDATFDGVFSWYSTIHSPDDRIPVILAEARRVLRSGGLVVVAFQAGTGVHDVAGGYRQHGHDVSLVRYSRDVTWMGAQLAEAGFRILARLERSASGAERDGQGVLIARATQVGSPGH